MDKNKKILIIPAIVVLGLFCLFFANFGKGFAVTYQGVKADAPYSIFDLAFGMGGARVFGGITFGVILYLLLFIFAVITLVSTYKEKKTFETNIALGISSAFTGILYFCFPAFVLAQNDPLPAGYGCVGSAATICLGVFLLIFAVVCFFECYIIKRLENGKSIIPDKLANHSNPAPEVKKSSVESDEVKNKIAEYKKMLDDGLIDEEEFKKIKEKLIEKM